MSLTLKTITPNSAWNSALDFLNEAQLVKKAVDGDVQAARQVVRDGADYIVSALQAGSAATDTIVDLITDLGITFPSGFNRNIEIEAVVNGDTAATEAGHLVISGMFQGGTTPLNLIDVNVSAAVKTTNMAGAVGGFTTSDPSIQFGATGANSVPVTVTNEGAAESNRWTLRIKVGRLIPISLGV